MGEPGENVDGSFDSEGDNKELLRGLEAALGRVDDRDDSGVDHAVPRLFDSRGTLGGSQGGFAESSAVRAATNKDEAAAKPARKVQRAPSSHPRVESAVTGVRANRSQKDPDAADATPERRVSARVGPSPAQANLGAGSSNDHMRNAGGGPPQMHIRSQF